MLNGHHRILNDETLVTLMCEVESILNNRPLTPVLDDPVDPAPLTPNHLLLLAPANGLPPGNFTAEDGYGRKRWRQADVFWIRWKKEYVRNLQERQKWFKKQPNLKIGDLVLIIEAIVPRNQWTTGRVVELNKSADGNVRSAKIRVPRSQERSANKETPMKETPMKSTVIERPIVKLITLMSD